MMKVMNSDWILLHSQNVGHTLSHLSGAGVRAGCQQVGMEVWIVGRVNTKGSSSCSVQQGQLSRFGLCPALKLCPVH